MIINKDHLQETQGHFRPTMFLMPIADRSDFCKVAEKLFKKSNNAIEIGVFTGAFAEHNLNHWSGD